MKQTIVTRSIAAAVTAAVLGLGGMHFYGTEAAHAQPPLAASAIPTATAPLAALPDFAELAARTGPAVVNISVVENMKPAAFQQQPGLSPDDPFYEFFRRFQMPQPQQSQPARGIGSGFIVSPDGVILTNAHVVNNASEVTVKLTDRREFQAKVIGSDPQSDIAVLKIEAKNLPTVRLGSAKNLRPGEWVVAIGSPYGFENTVTSGIVSATSRALPDGTSVPFIQTDVAVNPGNSGGPLFNLKGEVVGVNSQIYSRTGGYQGLSFAIPIDTAVFVKDQLVSYGKVTRGKLGVAVQEVSQGLARSFGMANATGALVSSIEKGSAAEKAGLKPGDVVLKVDGAPVGSSLDLSNRIAGMKPGTRAALEIWRNGKPQDLNVVLGEQTPQKVASAGGEADLSGTKLGVAVRALTPDERKQVGVESGVLVEQAAGHAARAGIREGDIIVSVNGKPVKSAADLKAAMQGGSKTVAVLVQREDARIFVPVEIG
jgi:serine protease Do